MKNNTIKFVTLSLLAAVAFLVYPATFDVAGQGAKVNTQNVIVDYEADQTVSMPGLELL